MAFATIYVCGNTVICMKVFIQASSAFLYVCSLERNAGKVYGAYIITLLP